MKPFLMGSETEYAISGRRPQGQLEADEVYALLAQAIRHERASVPDCGSYRGMFLEHGGRLYFDYGGHPEHATPECFTPAQVACYDKAGERLLSRACRQAEASQPGLRLAVIKNNLDPVHPDLITYGTHESYTSWVWPAEAAEPLLPFLATRIIYAGAGCLSGHGNGMGFELSQRSRHIVRATGSDTTNDRALFSLRVRKESDYSADGWTRLHLIGKDSQRSPFGIYLTFAATGLIVCLLNQGLPVGQGLQLADPVDALRRISRDPWLRVKVRLANGQERTALDIQEDYLSASEQALPHGDLPEWAPEALRHWKETLEQMRRDPLRLARRLDPYCKLLIYEHELLRAGLEWAELRDSLAKLARLRQRFEPSVINALVTGAWDTLAAALQPLARQAREEGGLEREQDLERLRFAVRLQALELQYHQLGGLYDRLRAAGQVENVVVSTADIERATWQAPPGGRAAARAAAVREHHGEEGWRGDWQFLWHEDSGRCVDLRDPFRSGSRLVTLRAEGVEADEEDDPDVLEQLRQLDAR
jgi:proteasome accessory factor A